jgi:chromosome segregation ATPase
MSSPTAKDLAEAGVSTGARDDVEYWRSLARGAGERLKIAEEQSKSLRMAADEARARVTKYKGRLEGAQARVNELQSTLIEVSAERDSLRSKLSSTTTVSSAKLARQEELKRWLFEYRESLLNGPIFEMFAEMCREAEDVDASASADGDKR